MTTTFKIHGKERKVLKKKLAFYNREIRLFWGRFVNDAHFPYGDTLDKARTSLHELKENVNRIERLLNEI